MSVAFYMLEMLEACPFPVAFVLFFVHSSKTQAPAPLFVFLLHVLFLDSGKDSEPLNETFVLTSVAGEVCVTLEVYLDNLVEEDEMIKILITTEDPAIMLVQPSIANITIINSDG